jgi:homoserine/homoserine lactone efflux protein
MTFETWALFAATDLVLCFVPGPAVLYVVSTALARGGRSGVAATFGIVAGNTFYFALSATGIAAVILASGEAFRALQWTGAAYLVWTGLRMLAGRGQHVDAAENQGAVRRAFLRGFVVQASNPKALVFFIALLPQFIEPAHSIGMQILVLWITSQTIELAVLSLYVVAAVRARRLAGAGLAASLERIGGGFLVAAGARLAFVRAG